MRERKKLNVYVAESGWYCPEKSCREAKVCPGCGFRTVHYRTAFKHLIEVWPRLEADDEIDGYAVDELLTLANEKNWKLSYESCYRLDLPPESRSWVAVRGMLYTLNQRQGETEESWVGVLDAGELHEARVLSSMSLPCS